MTRKQIRPPKPGLLLDGDMIHGATDELVTVRDWLRWAVSRFNEAGLCSATAPKTPGTKRSGWCWPRCTCRATRSSPGSMPA
jgi:hypothetical protein